VSEPRAINDHGIATVACLLSGLEIFGETRSEHGRLARIVEGLHGFHVYATEYWTEYLLAHVASLADGPDASPSKLLALALELASRFAAQLPSSTGPEDVALSKQIQDERLYHLQRFPLLYQCVVANLRCRSLEGLESALLAGHCTLSNRLVFPSPSSQLTF
jgi:hypothetical protein